MHKAPQIIFIIALENTTREPQQGECDANTDEAVIIFCFHMHLKQCDFQVRVENIKESKLQHLDSAQLFLVIAAC